MATTDTISTAKTDRPKTLRRRIVFPIAAILLGLSPFVAAEAVCRIFDWGRPTNHDDPFIGFSDVHPLFVLDDETGRYEIPPSRRTHFCEDGFAAKKVGNEYRIFVLGGSTVQGRPWAIQTAFPCWLELSLNAADPSRRWQVVNCGGISYASYRLVPILQEVLRHQPDLIIVCTGHNEFLEDRTYGHIKRATGFWGWSQRQASNLRIYTLLRNAMQSQPAANKGRPKLSREVQARLDFRNGLKLYKRDEQWRKNVMEHFVFNLQRMIDLTREADVPLMLVCPVSNLDWPPFKSEHRDGISETDKKRFDELVESAKPLYRTDLAKAVEVLQQASKIDNQHAHLHYEIGKCYQQMNMFDDASAAFWQALENDICPLRMLPPMRKAMMDIAEENGTPYFDAHTMFTQQSTGGITGRRWLVDHVHPTIGGHKIWAKAMLDKMVEMKILSLRDGWELARDDRYQLQMEQLDNKYFLDGDRTLKAVQRWAHGLADKEKANGP